MTVYAPRAPLQLIENPHIMSEAQRNGRRHSSRLAGKEDTIPNGIGHAYEQVKQSQKTAAAPKGGKTATGAKNSNKRKPSYDEEDAGFTFTRTRAKKAKAEPKQPPIAEEAPPSQTEPPAQRRTRKKSEDIGSATTNVTKVPERAKRRSARHSGGSAEESDPPTLAVKKRRKGTPEDVTHTPAASQERQHNEQRRPQPEEDHTHPFTINSDSTQIALPFADTPIIRRNQEMRRGHGSGSRRSSLGMRGRRASSLIDTGKSNALPHDEVDTADFYKHIASEGLSEPRRMKQLLTWCGTRALGERPLNTGKDRDAVLAAREIQSQLLRDFSTKSSLSDWFSREDLPNTAPSPPKQNPKNQANEAKIKELEAQLAALHTSRQSYTTLLSPPSIPPLPSAQSSQPSGIDPTSLPPSQQDHLAILSSSSVSTTAAERVNTLTQALEPRIDAFATNVHTVASYVKVAGGLADEALAACAKLLDAREKTEQGQESAEGEGMRDVLRGLSRVVEER